MAQSICSPGFSASTGAPKHAHIESNLVRLVAFRNSATPELTQSTVVEKWIGAEEFYDVLARWRKQFEAELEPLRH